jgi:DNA gyrase subunit A
MEVGLVKRIDIDEEMQQAYLDYAMSVIVARALPDARDGLKPVHRRILYAMHDMGLRADTPYKKSARIVGEVLGKYHPHGDMAVYDAMARMAQDFSMRYLLVDGQGNFGSVDGDPPAAMRYTEARLARLSQLMLSDIQKNTVDFAPNFDDTLEEPAVLPAALPNLLVNGATGIAVGMATSIPPHNLGEVVDALKYMLDNWTKLDDITVDDLMQFIQGPDFPTGGVIIEETAENEGLHSAYGSGRGRVTVQARANLEEMERGRTRIIVTELPYMTNKSALIERIAELVREERLNGISDLRDESDRQGMRIVIELNKNADPETTLRDLYKHTPMQGTFSMILLALVDGEPRMLSLKQALRVYVDHRLEIVKRRSQYDLERAKARAHILEGLRIALKNLDEIIDLIRKAPDAEAARERLMKRYRLSELQANAILDMQLRRLAALERKKIEDEYKQVLAQIKELEALLRSPVKMRSVVAEELQAVRDTYGDRRRTQIIRLQAGEGKRTLLTTRDLTPEKSVWVVVTAAGKISRTHDEKLPRLVGGVGFLQERGSALLFLQRAGTRDTLYLACERGETAALAVASIPEAENPQNGVPIGQVSVLKNFGQLAAVFALPPKSARLENHYLLTVTRQGMVKKSSLDELPGPSAGTFSLVKVNEGDRLGWAYETDGQADLLLVTAKGAAIRFAEEEVRPMGLVAAGVMGIKLQEGDELAGAEALPQAGAGLLRGTAVFLAATDGTGKRVPVEDFPKQGRYGQGVTAWKLPKGQVAGSALGAKDAQVVLHQQGGAQVIRLDAAAQTTRAARGGRVVDVKTGGEVVRVVLAGTFQESPAPAKTPGGSQDGGPAGGEKKQAEVGMRTVGKRTPSPAVKSPAAETNGRGRRRSAATQGSPPAQKSVSQTRNAPKTAPATKRGAAASGASISKQTGVEKKAPPSKKSAAPAAPAVKGTAAQTPAAKTPAASKAKAPAKQPPAVKEAGGVKKKSPTPNAPAKPAAGKGKPAAAEPRSAAAKTRPTSAASKTAAVKSQPAVEKNRQAAQSGKPAAKSPPAAKTSPVTGASPPAAGKPRKTAARTQPAAEKPAPAAGAKSPAGKRAATGSAAAKSAALPAAAQPAPARKKTPPAKQAPQESAERKKAAPAAGEAKSGSGPKKPASRKGQEMPSAPTQLPLPIPVKRGRKSSS